MIKLILGNDDKKSVGLIFDNNYAIQLRSPVMESQDYDNYPCVFWDIDKLGDISKLDNVPPNPIEDDPQYTYRPMPISSIIIFSLYSIWRFKLRDD